MITNYFYNEQLRNYLLQFCAIFVGLRVKTGKGECDEPQFITVPIHIGDKDRVVAALTSGNTQNMPFGLPLMSAYLQSLEMAPERRKGVGVTDARTFLPTGSVFPTDLRTVKRYMPIPYNVTIELSLYTSNTDQLFQVLEQILVLFDPIVEIQINDAPFDWARQTKVELIGIANEENYPAAGDRRIKVWSFQFMVPIWLSLPMDIRDELVRKIIIQMGDLDGFNITEFDEDGNLQPFTVRYDSFWDSDGVERTRPIIIDESAFPIPVEPPKPEEV